MVGPDCGPNSDVVLVLTPYLFFVFKTLGKYFVYRIIAVAQRAIHGHSRVTLKNWDCILGFLLMYLIVLLPAVDSN